MLIYEKDWKLNNWIDDLKWLWYELWIFTTNFKYNLKNILELLERWFLITQLIA